MGKLDAWLRRFFRPCGKSLEACPTRTSRHGCHVLSTRSSVGGGHPVTRRSSLVLILALPLLGLLGPRAKSASQSGGELHFCLRGEPKTFNPLLVEEDASETVRYLTGGVLIRLNRQTQALEPGLAVSWKVSEEGRKIS